MPRRCRRRGRRSSAKQHQALALLDTTFGEHFSGFGSLNQLQVRAQFARTLVAVFAIFLQALVDDALQFAGILVRSDRSSVQKMALKTSAEVSPRKACIL